MKYIEMMSLLFYISFNLIVETAHGIIIFTTMKSNTVKAASSQAKKRKRQVSSQNAGKGADLPEIAQVPPITVPYLIGTSS